MQGLLTVSDICKVYGVSSRTVHRWIHRTEGALPYSIIGKTVAVKEADMKKWALKHLKQMPDGSTRHIREWR